MKIRCPNCSAKFKVNDSTRGKKVKCAKCGSPIDADECEIVESNKAEPVAKAVKESSEGDSGLDAIRAKIDEHDVDLAVALERVDELSSKIENAGVSGEVENRLISIEGKLAALEEEIHDIQTQEQSTSKSPAAESVGISPEAKNKFSSIDNQILSLVEKIHSIQAKEKSSQDNNYSSTIDVLKLSIKGLETKIADFSKQINALNEVVNTLKSKQSHLEKSIENIDTSNSHSTIMPSAASIASASQGKAKSEVILEETGIDDDEVEEFKPSKPSAPTKAPQQVSQEDATIEEMHLDEEDENLASGSSAEEIIIDQGEEETVDGGSHEELAVDEEVAESETVYEDEEEVVEETEEEEIEEDVDETVKEEIEETAEEIEEEVVEEEVVEEEVVEEVEEEVVEEEVVEEEVVEEEVVEEEVVEEEVVEEEVVEEEVVVEEGEEGEATVPMPQQPPAEEDDKKKKGRSRRGKDSSAKAEDSGEQPKKKGLLGKLMFWKK